MSFSSAFSILVVWRTRTHDCKPLLAQIFFLLCKPSRTRVALSATASSLSALAHLLIKRTVILLSEYRQASERQEPVHKSTFPIKECPEPENVDQSGWGASVSLWAWVRAYLLRLLSRRALPVLNQRTLRVRLNQREDVRTERSHVAQSRISDHRVVSR